MQEYYLIRSWSQEDSMMFTRGGQSLVLNQNCM